MAPPWVKGPRESTSATMVSSPPWVKGPQTGNSVPAPAFQSATSNTSPVPVFLVQIPPTSFNNGFTPNTAEQAKNSGLPKPAAPTSNCQKPNNFNHSPTGFGAHLKQAPLPAFVPATESEISTFNPNMAESPRDSGFSKQALPASKFQSQNNANQPPKTVGAHLKQTPLPAFVPSVESETSAFNPSMAEPTSHSGLPKQALPTSNFQNLSNGNQSPKSLGALLKQVPLPACVPAIESEVSAFNSNVAEPPRNSGFSKQALPTSNFQKPNNGNQSPKSLGELLRQAPLPPSVPSTECEIAEPPSSGSAKPGSGTVPKAPKMPEAAGPLAGAKFVLPPIPPREPPKTASGLTPDQLSKIAKLRHSVRKRPEDIGGLLREIERGTKLSHVPCDDRSKPLIRRCQTFFPEF